MRTVNVGVIGVGAMGENHVRVYHKIKEANLLAVSDVSERALKKIERKYGAKGYTDYGELLKNPEIEAVSVCVPTTLHHAVVMEAIKNKKHVLIEKPIAFTLKEMFNAEGESIQSAPHPMMDVHITLPAKCGKLALLRKLR